MLLYNITIKIEEKVQADWRQWMKTVQIPAYLATGSFAEYKFCRILGDDDEHGITYALQLFCEDLHAFQIYQDAHAKRLQTAHAERYPNQYVAFRTLMEVIDQA